jgi:hypothetical protein
MEKDAEDLLKRARKLRKELRAFGRDARKFVRTRPDKPEDELEILEGDMLGTVECLLMDDLEPALRKLEELDGLLKRVSVLERA